MPKAKAKTISKGESLVAALTHLAANLGVNQEDEVKTASGALARYVRKLEKELVERGVAIKQVKVKVE